jgi:hypothetical protein
MSTTKPTVRFALPTTPKKKEPFSVRRVYSAILLVWIVIVMGIVRLGRDRVHVLGIIGDGIGGEGLVKRSEDVLTGDINRSFGGPGGELEVLQGGHNEEV